MSPPLERQTTYGASNDIWSLKQHLESPTTYGASNNIWSLKQHLKPEMFPSELFQM